MKYTINLLLLILFTFSCQSNKNIKMNKDTFIIFVSSKKTICNTEEVDKES